jgi:hypothetical protein
MIVIVRCIIMKVLEAEVVPLLEVGKVSDVEQE